MKTGTKHTNKEIELAVWQFFALVIAAIACLFAMAPLISRYRSNKCDIIYVDNAVKPQFNNSEVSLNFRGRYVREVSLRAECDDIPPLCSATTTVPTPPTTSTLTTTRSTVSTVSVTRPVITNFPTQPPTTTRDPWANLTRPYSSWRLPQFSKPLGYTLYIACPDCFVLTSTASPITFNGRVTIRIDISNPTNFLVLHAKNLNIIQASLTSGGTGTANITYLPDYEMVYLLFSSPIAIGEITLDINYIGNINQQDQTGFYRELFWKSIGEIS